MDLNSFEKAAVAFFPERSDPTITDATYSSVPAVVCRVRKAPMSATGLRAAHPNTGRKHGQSGRDDVQSCIECHKKPEYIKGKKAKGLSKKQKREYHANAIHDNCKGCHKKFNKEKGLKSKDKGAAPTTCKSCHPKTK